MIKFIKISVIVLLIIESFSFTYSKSLNNTSIDENNSESTEYLTNSDKIVRNSSLVQQTAESRLFPVGHPGLLASHANNLSPFDVASFGKQLLPLINFHVKEKVKDFAKHLTSSADYIEDAIRDGWRESPLNPNNFKHILNPTNLVDVNSLRATGNSLPTSHRYREKAPSKGTYNFPKDGPLQEYGIDGYKHFEKSILRELEKQEELKVEATIHTLFEQGDRVEIIHGKPYNDHKLSWKPVAAPTKNYEDPDEIHSQIISPLHTSIFSADSLSNFGDSNIASSFHDFDNLNDNSIHSGLLLHTEEELESKIKPVVEQNREKIAKITPIRLRATTSTTTSAPSNVNSTKKPRSSTRYKKRHNNSVLKVIGGQSPQNVTKYHVKSNSNSSASSSHNNRKPVRASVKPIKLKSYDHIHNLTTSRPTSFKLTSLKAEESRIFTSTDNSWHRVTTTTTTTLPTTTKTTTKTTRASKATPKFVDKTRSSGYRGSVKFGQTTKKPN